MSKDEVSESSATAIRLHGVHACLRDTASMGTTPEPQLSPTWLFTEKACRPPGLEKTRDTLADETSKVD